MAPKGKKVFRILGGVGAIAVVGFLGYSAYLYKQSGIEEHGIVLEQLPGFRGVHWHARLLMSACGKKLKLPLNSGTPLLHTHTDATKIHIEGLIPVDKGVTLGQFMDAVRVPFASDTLFTYKNDDVCPDPGSDMLRMKVNGAPSTMFREQQLKDGDVIELDYN